MTKILNVNDLCDAIAASTLDDVTQRDLIDALETLLRKYGLGRRLHPLKGRLPTASQRERRVETHHQRAHSHPLSRRVLP